MFTERLTKLRLSKSLTHQDMADKLGMTRQGYGYYESGKRTVDSETLAALADILEVDTDYLLGRTSQPKSLQDETGIAFYGGPDQYSQDEIEVMEAALKAYREQKKKLLR
ncbi:XRE family transcriptional regulator [Paenibacillus zeisoli]|uniref:XRE family transcriptional regulator n=1 Tax=Paenibacillus zeisoli TaxID=2496267 RepID=A0A3S1BX03_9BACL|nr:helix-turn-helix transcriptional regulator [Paenibacillus zeisoli]RUT36345.1 XRE family transcriptional regulator [Paenibacillus zeisoli]